MRNLFLGSVALLLLGTPFVYTWRITPIEIRVLEGLCLLVMCLYVKGQLPISRLWHLWVRECYFCGKSNFWGICQLFIWRVYDVMLAWPLSMFSLAILIFNRFFFYFGYVSPLLFGRKCTCTGFNLSIACLGSQICRKLVDLVQFDQHLCTVTLCFLSNQG